MLNANNPHAPGNIVRFSHKEHVFKAIPSIDQLAVHFVMERYSTSTNIYTLLYSGYIS